MFAVLRDINHLHALLFSALIIFAGFTVIPYITLYAVSNVGISLHNIPYVYLAGGAATLVSARRIGRWADLHGKVKVYRLVAAAALLPLFAVSQIGIVPLWLWLICTTTFFVLVSGRTIPAMAIVTSAAQPKLRGTFMSLNATMQSLAMGLATTLAVFYHHTRWRGENCWICNGRIHSNDGECVGNSIRVTHRDAPSKIDCASAKTTLIISICA